MWENAEAVALLDREGCIRAVSRNEDEAVIKDVIGLCVLEERILEDCRAATQKAFEAALNGKETAFEIGARGDDRLVVWSRAVMKPSPLPETPVLFHIRRLPTDWGILSSREQEIINTLHEEDLNPKRAAKLLDITLNTFNAHRRAITQKCDLQGVGDFWVFVERCR